MVWPRTCQHNSDEYPDGSQKKTKAQSSTSYRRLLRTVSTQVLNISRYGDFTASLGNLRVWQPLPKSFISHKIYATASHLFIGHHQVALFFIFTISFISFHHTWPTLIRSLLSLLLSKLNSSSTLSTSLHDRCSNLFITSMASYCTHYIISMPFFYWGAQNWTQDTRCGLTTTEKRGRSHLLMTVLLIQPRILLAFLPQGPQGPLVLLHQAVFQQSVPNLWWCMGLLLSGCRIWHFLLLNLKESR